MNSGSTQPLRGIKKRTRTRRTFPGARNVPSRLIQSVISWSLGKALAQAAAESQTKTAVVTVFMHNDTIRLEFRKEVNFESIRRRQTINAIPQSRWTRLATSPLLGLARVKSGISLAMMFTPNGITRRVSRKGASSELTQPRLTVSNYRQWRWTHLVISSSLGRTMVKTEADTECMHSDMTPQAPRLEVSFALTRLLLTTNDIRLSQ